jgi:BirA family transcriptional regulator, biotin operon repressor / biotin---[acetyl-CoA-carboxylase] ligase
VNDPDGQSGPTDDPAADAPPQQGGEADAGEADAEAEASEPETGEAPVPARPREPIHVGPDTIERFGRPMRVFPVAVSCEVMAQAWANQDAAPHGAAVIVEHEINPRGLHGSLWQSPSSDTLALAVVLRPSVSPEESDATWMVAALAGTEGAEAATGMKLATWWPDGIIEQETGDPVGAVKSEVQLGPGQVKSAVVTIRFDLMRLEVDTPEKRDALTEAVVHAVDRVAEQLSEGPARVATAYGERCAMLDKRLKVRLRPKGETRGVAKRVDRGGRLEIESLSGMVERIGVNQLMSLDVVEARQR